VAIQRPNRLRVCSRGDLTNEVYVYDGKRTTHFDRRSNTFASVDVPATIDAAIDFLAQRYGLTPPLADLAYKDPYQILNTDVTSGAYIGLSGFGAQPATNDSAVTQGAIIIAACAITVLTVMTTIIAIIVAGRVATMTITTLAVKARIKM
jgi:hypothetical protein